MIKLKELSFAYKNSQKIIDGVNLDILPGQLLAILGASGSGKSTLLGLLSGLLTPERGGVYNSKGETPSCSLVFQDYALFPNLSVEDNLRFVAVNDQEIDSWMDRLQIHAFKSQKPSSLSGGQQQRVAVARAMLCKPEMLLLDEPFSNLDTAHKNELRLTLKSLLKADNQTTVLVTHDLEDAFALADRIVVLENGSVVQDDAPEEIYQKPKSKNVLALTGGYTAIPLDGSLVYCRPENIQQNSGDILVEVKVLENQFSGSVYKVLYEINGFTGYFYSAKKIKDLTIKIGLNNSHVIRFN